MEYACILHILLNILQQGVQLCQCVCVSHCLQKVFHGPLHMFGKLMFRRMITHPRSERVTRDEFVSCGKKILSMKKVSDQQEFYIGLFLAGQDFFTKHG